MRSAKNKWISDDAYCDELDYSGALLFVEDFREENLKVLGPTTLVEIAQYLLQINTFRVDFFLEDLATTVRRIETGEETLDNELYRLKFMLKYDLHWYDYLEIQKWKRSKGHNGVVCVFDLADYMKERPLTDSVALRVFSSKKEL